MCALGAISLGYGWPSTTSRVYSLPHLAEVEAAEAILRDVAPWASHVRFTKTGSEATHAAYRIAKRATGRRHVLMGDWAYHGWHEWCEKRPDGTPELDTTVLYAHGARSLLQDEPVAAIFVEPHRWEPVDVGWLRYLREWCDACGALLVFDEMIYGGRVALGGATEFFGVTPDLACFGKAIGNGAPIACVVGRDVLRDYGEIVSGTYSGHAGDLAAVVSVLNAYRHENVIEWLWSRGRQLQRGLLSVCAPYPWATAEGLPVHQRIRFDTDARGHAFSAEMVKRGIIWAPYCANVCRAHSEADIERVVVATEESLRVLAEQGDV